MCYIFAVRSPSEVISVVVICVEVNVVYYRFFSRVRDERLCHKSVHFLPNAVKPDV